MVSFSHRILWQTLQEAHVHGFGIDPRFFGQDAPALIGEHHFPLAVLEGRVARGLTQAGDHVAPVRIGYGYGGRARGEQRSLKKRQIDATLRIILDEGFVRVRTRRRRCEC